MTDEARERVRKFVADWCGPTPTSVEQWAHVTDQFIDGVLKAATAPPAPKMPVVSEAAIQAANAAAHPIGGWQMANILRAAFPHMLRDSLAALPRRRGADIALGDGHGMTQAFADKLISVLTGATP